MIEYILTKIPVSDMFIILELSEVQLFHKVYYSRFVSCIINNYIFVISIFT